jgi:ABC-type Fe3+-hydroxamate transport system substrate-binding protein
MRKQLLGSVFIALLLLVGCKQPVTFGGEPRTKHYRSVISLSPSTTELMALTGIPMKGRTQACDFPVQVRDVEVVADLKPNYELIATKKPDLILFDRDLYGPSEIEKLKQTGAKVLPMGAYTVEGHIKEMYELGNLLSGEATINDYVIKLRKNVQASKGEKPPRPITAIMVIPDSSGHHMIAGSKSFQADMMQISGATLLGPDSNRFESLNPEWVLSQNPDWIVVAGTVKEFLSDTRFSGLSAVKNSKIFGIDQGLCLRRGMRVDKFIYGAHKLLMLGEAKK